VALTHFLIVDAGAAGLLTGRELARVGKKVCNERPVHRSGA